MPSHIVRPQVVHYTKGGKTKKRNQKAGTLAAKPYTRYGLPAGASSDQQAALMNRQKQVGAHQDMIDNHGGRKKYTRRRLKKTSKKMRQRSLRKRFRKRTKKTKRRGRVNRKRIARRKKRTRRYRGGDGRCNVPQSNVTVPSFRPPGGVAVGPGGATSTSQGTNSTQMQAGADACNDCFATKTCNSSGGKRKSRRKNGGKDRKWGCYSGGKGSRPLSRNPNTNNTRLGLGGATLLSGEWEPFTADSATTEQASPV